MALKTVTVEVSKLETLSILNGARENLGRVVVQYEGQETFQFLINEAKADVAKWQAVLDLFN